MFKTDIEHTKEEGDTTCRINTKLVQNRYKIGSKKISAK